jgi:hypothetical protein
VVEAGPPLDPVRQEELPRPAEHSRSRRWNTSVATKAR